VSALAFTILAALLVGPVPALLARADWPLRAPRATVVLWQAIALAAVLSAFSAGIAIASRLLMPGADGRPTASVVGGIGRLGWPLWMLYVGVFALTILVGARLAVAVLRVPRERVLLSLFDDWHAVLNGVPAFPDDVDAGTVDDWFDRLSKAVPGWMLPGRGWTGWPAELRGELERSWARIFAVDAAPRRAWVQATVEEIFAADVLDAVVPVAVARRRPPAVEGMAYEDYRAVRAGAGRVRAAGAG